MRRPLTIAGAAVIAALTLAPSSRAAESISDGGWQGSALDAGPSSVDYDGYTLSGTFRHAPSRSVKITVSANPPGEGACAVPRITLPAADTPRRFTATLSMPCNGTYSLVATAVTADNSAVLPPDSASLDRRVSISAPAPTVTGVSAVASDRTITVSWDSMTSVAPDVSNYIVQRQLDGESFAHLANISVSQQSYTDTDFPEEGGDAAYQVLAVRPSPDGELTSAPSAEARASYAAVPPPTTTTAPATSTTAGAGGSGGSGTAGGGSGSAGSGGQAAAPGGSPPGISPPRVFSGTFLPPLLRPAQQTITTVDPGFDETLPYGERIVREPALPGESLASITSESQAGRGMAIPVATALVLAIWAVHLRMLARASRPLD